MFKNILKQYNINNIIIDSRKVNKGDLFIAISGNNVDGHLFVNQAVKNGASVIILEKDIPVENNVKKIIVPDTRKALGELSNIYYNYPFDKIFTIGITGTNGKTTTSYLLESIFKQAGFNTSVLGTIEHRLGNKVISSNNTTPGSPLLQKLGCKMLKQDIDHCIMEVSSHSLSQDRLFGINFDIAVFTNLGQDHLEYHGSMENYLKAKQILFKNLKKNTVAVINKDDNNFNFFKNASAIADICTYGINKNADIFLKQCNDDGLLIDFPKGEVLIKTGLIGIHNIYNILAAFSVGYSKKIDIDIIKKGLEKINFIPGRLESIEYNEKKIFIDYAHTPCALKIVLEVLRKICKKRLIIVFGCGGNRDKCKRKKMGKTASDLADFSFITNDNPRDEVPDSIIEDIKQGFGKNKNFKVTADRKNAICEALNFAASDDIVLIAGKGHEDYQEIKGMRQYFKDREIVEDFFKNKDK